MSIKIGFLLFLVNFLCYLQFSSSKPQQQNGIKQCAEINQYCQNHWDCCSNSCLSFSYKCVKSNQQPVFISGVQNTELGNRFGGPGVATVNVLPFLYFPQAGVYGVQPEVVASVDEIIDRFSGVSNSNTNTNPNIVKPVNTNLNTRFQTEENNNINKTVVDTNPGCLGIGERCYRHDECCTGRCHGFLHQCVT